MTKKILITGGSGLVGSQLSSMLEAQGQQVRHLSRSKTGNPHYETFQWDIKKNYIDENAFDGVSAVIHLAGAGVADKRWTEERKQEIMESRTLSTQLLYDVIKKIDNPPSTFVSASAIGYYGSDTGEKLMDESSDKGKGFLAEVVDEWEKKVDQFEELNVRVVKIRIGIVLSQNGGALPKIAAPVKYFVGAPLGSGQQYMSWIHIEDLCQLFLSAALKDTYQGTYNAVAPNPVTNEEFTRILAQKLNRFLFLPNVPAFVLKLMLGEMSSILLGGNRVKTERLDDKTFKFKTLDQAINNLL